MSADLDLIISKVKDLSVEDLRTLQNTVSQELSQKTAPANNGHSFTTTQSKRYIKIPGAIRRTPEEIEAHLAAIFTPEKLAELRKVDLSNLPPGLKTVTEMLSEDREDRF